MSGRNLVFAAAAAGISLLGSAALGGNCSNAPPAISICQGTVNGKPALCVELTDPDGAADLLGYGFDYVMSDGSIYAKPLSIFLWVYGKKGMTSSSVPNGKLLCFTKLPGNVVQWLAFGLFDAAGATVVSDVVPPGLSGLTWTLVGWGIGHDGRLKDSTPQTLTFE